MAVQSGSMHYILNPSYEFVVFYFEMRLLVRERSACVAARTLKEYKATEKLISINSFTFRFGAQRGA